jgi:hypothetical protein
MKRLFLILNLLSRLLLCKNFDETSPNSNSDTSDIYKKIEIWAYKHKFTKWLFNAIFISEYINPVKDHIQTELYADFLKYEGRIISKIHYKVLAPFETDVSSPFITKYSTKNTILNSLHIKSKKAIIKMFSLLKEGDSFDPEKAKETERLLRENEFIRDAKIHIFPSETLNEVELIIAVQDVWSLVGEADGDLNHAKYTLMEKNLLGLGQSLRYQERINYKYRLDQTNSGINFVSSSKEVNYSVPNILNTFTDFKANYFKVNGFENKAASINRPFFSPSTRFAFSAFITDNEYNFFSHSEDSGYYNPFTKRIILGNYVGSSFKMSRKGGIYSDRLITYLGYKNINFKARPDFTIDTLFYQQNRHEFTFSFGLSKRNFYKEKFIFELGRNEDIPIGRSLSATVGKVWGEKRNFDYIGFDFNFANRSYLWGHFAFYLRYGKFFNWSYFFREYKSLRMVYFSPLVARSKGWALRQLLNIQFLSSTGALPFETASLNKYGNFFGQSINQYGLYSNFVLNYQCVIFPPITHIGFHFVPIIYGATGWTAFNSNYLFKNKPLQIVGIGLRLKNDRIASTMLILSLGYIFADPMLIKNNFLINHSGILQKNLNDLNINAPAFYSFE